MFQAIIYPISKKTNEPNLQKWQKKNNKNKNFGHHFGLFGPNLGPQNVLAGFTSTIS